MSHAYGRASDAQSVATIRRALDLDCNFLDTADEYGAGHNERLIGIAIRGRRNQAFLATKFGLLFNHKGATVGRNGRPDYVHKACDASLRRLRTEVIDLYYLHRVDPFVPIEETVGAMAGLVVHGKVRYLGLCEAAPEDIYRAHVVHPVAALQSEYSLWTRDPERDVIPACDELGIGFVAFSPLGRGFFTGTLERAEFGDTDFRKSLPRFQGDNFRENKKLLLPLRDFAQRKKCTPAQLALAWLLARSNNVTAIPGTARVTHLEENLSAQKVRLTQAEMQQIDQILPLRSFAGERYPESSPFKPKV
jgi:aryl-alcohol dehydrogenase-like predicted oxidoreductase